MIGWDRWRKNLPDQAGQLAPLGVGATAAHIEGERLQPLQRVDLGLQLHEGAGGGRLIQDRVLGILHLVVGGLVQVLQVVRVQRGQGGIEDGHRLATSLQYV